jgi:hypothetical protein
MAMAGAGPDDASGCGLLSMRPVMWQGRGAGPDEGVRSVGVVRVSALRQLPPVVVGSRPVSPGAPTVESGVATFWPVVAIALVSRVEHFGQVQVVLAFVGGSISGIGVDITLVCGLQDVVGGLVAVGAFGFAGRHLGLPTEEVALSSFEVRHLSFHPRAHTESEPLTA